MLDIFYINPTGLFSYGYAPNISFEDGKLINLIGVNEDKGNSSNGAGKTSLFNALCELLFGENPTGIGAHGVVNSVWDKGCCARVEFSSWEKVRYRVTLCRKWKEADYYPKDNDNRLAYTGTALFLDRLEGDNWVDCRAGSGMADTRKKILEVLGVSYRRFLAVAYMSHRVGSRFLHGTNKERVDILSGVTGVEEWDAILDGSRARKKDLGKQISEAETKIAFGQGALQELRRNLDELLKVDWQKSIQEYEKSLTTCRESETQWQAYLADLDVKIREAEVQWSQMDKGESFLKEIAELEASAKERLVRGMDVNHVRLDSSLAEEARRKAEDLNRARGELSIFQGSEGSLLDMDKCPTCGTLIVMAEKSKIKKKIAALMRRVETLEKEHKKAMDAVQADDARVQAEKEEARKQAEIEVAKLNKECETKRLLYNEKRKESEGISESIHKLRGESASAAQTLNGIQQDIFKISQGLETARGSVQAIVNYTDQIKEEETTINSMRESISSIQGDVDILGWLISNIPYIKLHKLSVSMGILSDLINEYLSEMGDTVRVDISAFDEKKSKKGADLADLLKSEIKVEITDGAKNIDPRLYSDGEIGKISNAFVRALRAMSLKSGQGCNILMLDEIFSFIDYANSQRLADSFVGNHRSGSVVVTDNSGKAGDLMTFDKLWVARKRNNLTSLEEMR